MYINVCVQRAQLGATGQREGIFLPVSQRRALPLIRLLRVAIR